MIIKVNSSAKKDLQDGYSFYERQETTIGGYFLDSLYSDIDSLIISAGVHQIGIDLIENQVKQGYCGPT